MSDFERAVEWTRRSFERMVERTVPFAFGAAMVHERLHRVHDLNLLWVDRAGASAAELAAEAERIQAPLGLDHRLVWIFSGEESRLEAGFTELHWKPRRFVLMALARASERSPDLSSARETDREVLRPIWAEGIRSAPFGQDEEVVSQLVEHKDVIAQAVPTRYYAAYADGKPASYCELYSTDGIGQVESVLTLEPYRGRGLASAVVLKAVAQSVADGNDLTFLVADAEDWPKELYRRLGFEEIGRYGKFLRLLQGEP
jgi:predicted GNAT family acetyltransferase